MWIWYRAIALETELLSSLFTITSYLAYISLLQVIPTDPC